MSIIPIAKWRDQQNTRRITKPYRRVQQANVDARKVGVDGCDDQTAVILESDADADDAKVHNDEGPDTPIDKDFAEIAEGPSVVG
jgi:hypothetical protein